MRLGAGRDPKEHLRDVADGRNHRGIHIAVGYMEDIRPGDLIEILAGKMRDGADACRRTIELAGILPGVGDKIGYGFTGTLGCVTSA